MTVITTKMRRGFGLALLALGSLTGLSCDKANADNPLLDKLAEQCGLSCPAEGRGVAYGNASISGYAPIDSFFRAVVNYGNTAIGVSSEINGELAGIQNLFQLTDADIKGKTLGAAIDAKLKAQYKASVVVNAQPAKCSVDARVAADVSARCQAEAKCDIEPGKATFECKGTCNVDVDVSGGCDASAKLHCTVTAPEFACKGQCSGTCTASVPTVECNAACSGECKGECMGGTKTGGVCSGTCMGRCEAGCQVTGMAALSCEGKCNGSCEYTPAMGSCDASAKVTCDLNASASASCKGRCDGEFVPPKVDCDASASCQASAHAEASFQVKCTPPSVTVKVVAEGGVMAQAQVDFLVGELQARLPRLAAVQAKARLAAEAGRELGDTGVAAINTTAKAVTEGEIGFFAVTKITQCVPPALKESSTVIGSANATLDASISNVDSVAKTFGMVML
ncbi:MAG: hypothetical protein RL701_5043 [Pseudomonadota bacterium]